MAKEALGAGILFFVLAFGCVQQQPPQANVTSCSDLRINPICGTDNKTYQNMCYAELANVTLANLGECQPPQQQTCNDSDIGEGQDVTVRGTITNGLVTMQDVCLNESVVVEYGCENDTITPYHVTCPPFYSCNDGRCVAGTGAQP